MATQMKLTQIELVTKKCSNAYKRVSVTVVATSAEAINGRRDDARGRHTLAHRLLGGKSISTKLVSVNPAMMAACKARRRPRVSRQQIERSMLHSTSTAHGGGTQHETSLTCVPTAEKLELKRFSSFSRSSMARCFTLLCNRSCVETTREAVSGLILLQVSHVRRS